MGEASLDADVFRSEAVVSRVSVDGDVSLESFQKLLGPVRPAVVREVEEAYLLSALLGVVDEHVGLLPGLVAGLHDSQGRLVDVEAGERSVGKPGKKALVDGFQRLSGLHKPAVDGV